MVTNVTLHIMRTDFSEVQKRFSWFAVSKRAQCFGREEQAANISEPSKAEKLKEAGCVHALPSIHFVPRAC